MPAEGPTMTSPSTQPIASAQYIFIGEMLNALQKEVGVEIELVRGHFAQLTTMLDYVGLPYPTKNLNAFLNEIEKRANLKISNDLMPRYMADELRNLIIVAHETITEAAESRLTIALDRGGVSSKLRSLPQQLIDLKSALDRGAINQQEYDQQKQQIMSQRP